MDEKLGRTVFKTPTICLFFVALFCVPMYNDWGRWPNKCFNYANFSILLEELSYILWTLRKVNEQCDCETAQKVVSMYDTIQSSHILEIM